jgi:hypothetical protein
MEVFRLLLQPEQLRKHSEYRKLALMEIVVIPEPFK